MTVTVREALVLSVQEAIDAARAVIAARLPDLRANGLDLPDGALEQMVGRVLVQTYEDAPEDAEAPLTD